MTPNRDLDEAPSREHALLERLVSGELDGPRRRDLLAWLDADPRRWRLCGLAFLEAQSWSQTLADWSAVDGGQPDPVSASTPCTRDRQARPMLRRGAAALAACAVLSFLLGIAAHRVAVSSGAGTQQPIAAATDTGLEPPVAPAPATTPALGPVFASVSLQTGSDSAPLTKIQIPVVPGARQPIDASAAAGDLPAGVRREWERRGFQLDTQRRYLLARLPDGEQIAVPVEQVHLNYVGPRVY